MRTVPIVPGLVRLLMTSGAVFAWTFITPSPRFHVLCGLGRATLARVGVTSAPSLRIMTPRQHRKGAARIGMAAIMERAAVAQSPMRKNRMGVIHDACPGRYAIAAKLSEVASLARVV